MKAEFALFFLLTGASMSACAQSDTATRAIENRGGAATTAEPSLATPASPSPAAAQDQAVQAATGTPAERARAVVRKLSPDAVVQRIAPAPLPLQAFQEVVVGGQVLYISNDGKVLIQGLVLDVDAKKNLADASLAKVRREQLEQAPQADRIVFAPPESKYRISVFTDIECGYCRKLHSEIAEINRLGIAVEYLAFPRMGPGSEDFRKMEAVWCAVDRRVALTNAKNGRPVPGKACKNPVAMQYQIGQRSGAGTFGTPMVLAEDGTQLGGYLTPTQLRAALDKLASEDRPAATSGMEPAGAPKAGQTGGT